MPVESGILAIRFGYSVCCNTQRFWSGRHCTLSHRIVERSRSISEGEMSASNQALRQDPEKPATFVPQPVMPGPIAVPNLSTVAPVPAVGALRVPSLRVMPLQPLNPMRRFARVPTHAVGVFPEHREYPRASLRLPLRLRGVNGQAEDFPITLVTRDISSSGVFFLCPRKLALETPIEL